MTGLVLLGLSGCGIGGSVTGWKPATQAAGTDIELDLGGARRIRGELIAIDSAGFLVLEPSRLVRVELTAVRGGSAYKTTFDAPPIPADTRERLRLMSRYPQGVPRGVERQLLQAYGLTMVEQES